MNEETFVGMSMEERLVEAARIAELNQETLERVRARREATRRHREYLAREAAKLVPAPVMDLMSLEAKFSKPKTKTVVETTKVDNNGWGKSFTEEQLTNTVIDSNITYTPKVKVQSQSKKNNKKNKEVM